MSFRQKLQFQLVKTLCISNKEATDLIRNSKVKVNQIITINNIEIKPLDDIEVDGRLIQSKSNKAFFILNKAPGIECTLNPIIKNNLLPFLPKIEGLFHIGRLDKDSEGLVLFSNEGKIHDKILRNSKQEVLKKYEVKINKEITNDFIHSMENGIEILSTKTLPCKLQKLDDFTFNIWLNQGLNRQIRRMCYKLNADVIILKRLEIGEIKLGNLEIGKTRNLNELELNYLKSLF